MNLPYPFSEGCYLSSAVVNARQSKKPTLLRAVELDEELGHLIVNKIDLIIRHEPVEYHISAIAGEMNATSIGMISWNA
jgi:hypothetical protein